MTAAWVDVQLWRYVIEPEEGWDAGTWDQSTWDAGYPQQDGWTSIICDVRGIDIQRGRNGVAVAGGYEAGVLNLELNNRDGQWSEFVDTGHGWEPALSAGVQLRVIASDGTVTSTLFRGWVENWNQVWTKTDDYLVVTCVDGWADLVQQAAVDWTPGAMGETVQQRLWRLLRMRAGWDDDQYPVRLQAGSIRCLGSSLWNLTERGLVLHGSSVADEILKTAQSDGGAAFLDGDGSFVYLNRSRWTSVGAVPPVDHGHTARPAQGTIPLFGDWCGTPETNELPYTDLSWSYDGRAPANVVVVANSDPPEIRDNQGNVLGPAWNSAGYTAVDSALMGRHRQVITLGDLRFMTQAEAVSLANFYLAAYADQFLRVDRLEVSPALDDRLWQVVMKLRLNDHVRVLRRTKTNTFDLECLVEGARYRITPLEVIAGKHYGTWTVTYLTSDAVNMLSSHGVKAKHLELAEV